MTRRAVALVPRLIVVLPFFPALWPFLVAPVSRGSGPGTTKAQWRLDTCGLLTRSEIAAVQGEPVTAMQEADPERPAASLGRCVYSVATASKWVSLEVDRASPEAAEQVAPGERPLPVQDLGGVAFWKEGAGGSLDVLERDAMLRIRVGGDEDEAVRMEKAKRLARHALARLGQGLRTQS